MFTESWSRDQVMQLAYYIDFLIDFIYSMNASATIEEGCLKVCSCFFLFY